MAKQPLRETDLYPAIKTLLEGQGYEVKSEIGAADVCAMRGDEDPVIVELKTGFSLSLFHQGVERQALSDNVYLAVPRGTGRVFLNALKANIKLCRRLGLGLITVRLEDDFVEIHLDPGPYKPRQSKARKTRLLREFAKRVGDPNLGGQTRQGLMTAYRQDALRCAVMLDTEGATKASIVASTTGVSRARIIMAADHYGWFERAATGIYTLTPKGCAALKNHSADIAQLREAMPAGATTPDPGGTA